MRNPLKVNIKIYSGRKSLNRLILAAAQALPLLKNQMTAMTAHAITSKCTTRASQILTNKMAGLGAFNTAIRV